MNDWAREFPRSPCEPLRRIRRPRPPDPPAKSIQGPLDL